MSRKPILYVFHEAGSIYISTTCETNVNELKQLVHLRGSKCINIVRSADIVVGNTSNIYRSIHENWIFESKTLGKLIPTDTFKIN